MVPGDVESTGWLCERHGAELRNSYFRDTLGLLTKEAAREHLGWKKLRNVSWVRHNEHGLLACTGPKWLAQWAGAINEAAQLPPGVLTMSTAMAEKLLASGPLAVRAIKQAAIQGMSMPLEDGLRLEQHLFRLLASTEDSIEGTRAFAEKRQPQWKGR